MDKKKLLISIISLVSSLILFFVLVYIFNSKGFVGWFRTEYLGLIAIIALSLLFIAVFVFGFIYLSKKIFARTSFILSIIGLVASISITTILTVGSITPSINNTLNIYHSNDGYLKEETNINIAVASDSHYGASSSSSEARHNIMNNINGNYDLFIHGGDVVDLGSNKNYLKEAVEDMSSYLNNQKVSFVMGNHDALINAEKPFKQLFLDGDNLNRVLNVAPKVHIVIFNMIWDYSEVTRQDMKWLENTLKEFPEDDCVIVQSHSYYFATGGKIAMAKWYDIDNTIKYITPVFEKYHVDLVISGHIHTMELMENNGVYYSLTGPFGGSRYDDNSIKTKANSYFLNGTDYGYSSYHIHDGQIDISYLNEHGNTLYNQSISY